MRDSHRYRMLKNTNLLDILQGAVPARPQRYKHGVGHQTCQLHEVDRRGRPVVPRKRAARCRNHCFDRFPPDHSKLPPHFNTFHRQSYIATRSLTLTEIIVQKTLLIVIETAAMLNHCISWYFARDKSPFEKKLSMIITQTTLINKRRIGLNPLPEYITFT